LSSSEFLDAVGIMKGTTVEESAQIAAACEKAGVNLINVSSGTHFTGKLFNIIIEAGITSYTFESRHDSTLNATNYLKRDKNYYEILSSQWQRTVSDLSAVFSEVGM
ncbi:MAG: hypothetical protein IJI45_09985, partial [Anaerolineaceae bacterium]|nr:hypothetical protein [Anaerolineaceae bacterium]